MDFFAFDNKRVLIIGAGKIGRAIYSLLKHYRQRDYGMASVDIADVHDVYSPGLIVKILSDGKTDSKYSIIKNYDVVISACPFTENINIAQYCLNYGASYFDLTEDVRTTNAIKEMAKSAKDCQVFMPQCGLAPGFINIAGFDLASQFLGADKKMNYLSSLKLRVGALPKYPTNALKYNVTWSIDGLINEYQQPCDAIVRGQFTKVQAMEGLETLVFNGREYEAFNTSGGLGTLCETLTGIESLDYKTIRYPGHCNLIKFMLNDMGLTNDFSLMKRLLSNAAPHTNEDTVIIHCEATGAINGMITTRSYHKVIDSNDDMTAIQLSTASSLCTTVKLVVNSGLTGFVKQEDLKLKDFIDNNNDGIYGGTVRN